MAACSCLLTKPIPWIAAIGSFLAFALSSELSFLPVFLSTSALILCPVIISRSVSCHSKSLQTEEDSELETIIQNYTNNQESNTQQQEFAEMEDENTRDYVLSASDVNESIEFSHTSSSQESENEWIFSDGSMSDEDSLIEIALPESQYRYSKKEVQDNSWYDFQQNCSMESHFMQQNWMDMMNEEDNLIEIDIFMGNIKSSRFEIEA